MQRSGHDMWAYESHRARKRFFAAVQFEWRFLKQKLKYQQYVIFTIVSWRLALCPKLETGSIDSIELYGITKLNGKSAWSISESRLFYVWNTSLPWIKKITFVLFLLLILSVKPNTIQISIVRISRPDWLAFVHSVLIG